MSLGINYPWKDASGVYDDSGPETFKTFQAAGVTVSVEPTIGDGINSGRKRYMVACLDCDNDVLHRATTGPACIIEEHLHKTHSNILMAHLSRCLYNATREIKNLKKYLEDDGIENRGLRGEVKLAQLELAKIKGHATTTYTIEDIEEFEGDIRLAEKHREQEERKDGNTL